MLNLKSATRNSLMVLALTGASFAFTACAERAAPQPVGPGRAQLGTNLGGAISPTSPNGFESYSCLTFRQATEAMLAQDKAAAEDAYRSNYDANVKVMDSILRELEAEQASLGYIRKLSKKIRDAGVDKTVATGFSKQEFLRIHETLTEAASKAFSKMKDPSGQTLVSCSANAVADLDDEDQVPAAVAAMKKHAKKAEGSVGIPGVTDFDIVCNIGEESHPRIRFVAYNADLKAATLSVSYVARKESNLKMGNHRFEYEVPATVDYRFKKKSGFSVPAASDGRESKLPVLVLFDSDTGRGYPWTRENDAQFKRDVQNVVAPDGCK